MERKALVLDASAILKWFTQEEERDKAIKIREKFLKGEIEIAVPDLILYEVGNALRFNPNFKSEDVKKAIESILEMEIDIIIPLPDTLKKAIELSYLKNITFYDAFYVALASDLEFDFITADEKLHEKIKDLGFTYLLSKIDL